MLFPLWKKKKRKLKNRYDDISNDKNQNEKSFPFSLDVFVLETFEFPCFLSSRTISTFFTIEKTRMYTRGCTRAKPFFPPVLNPATIPPIIRKRLERTLENVIASFSSGFWFLPVTFSHNAHPRLVNTLFQQHSHKTKWTSYPKTKEDVYNNRTHTSFLTGRSCQLVLPNGDHICCENLISSVRYSISFTPLYLSNKPQTIPYLKIPRFPNNTLVSSDRNSQFFFVSYSSYSFSISFKDTRSEYSFLKVVRSSVKLKKQQQDRIFDKRSCKDWSHPLRTLEIQFGPLMSVRVEGTSSHSKRMCGGEKSFLGRWNSGG